MKQTAITNFFTSPNLKKYQIVENVINPIRTRKKKSKNVENEASSSKDFSQSSETEKILLDAKHFENKGGSISEEDSSQIKKDKKFSKGKRRNRKKILDSSQNTITKFCSPEVKKDKRSDFNSNELRHISVEEEFADMERKWAETDEKIKNLKEILELTRESEQKFYKRREAERLQKQRRLDEIARRKNIEIKNCKDLSITEIQNLFEQNLDFLIDIKNGTRFCERHKLYNDGAKGLLYNDSCAAFTKEQVNKIVHLLHNRFDERNPLQLSRYYWGVLLPEITLKIFRDMYNMNEEEALHYLKTMPDSEGESDLDSDFF